MLLRDTLVILVVITRKLRRSFGLPVLDLTDAKGAFKSAVREMETANPKAEQRKKE